MTKVELEKIKGSIVKMAPLTPDPEEFLSWPIGQSTTSHILAGLIPCLLLSWVERSA